MSADNPISIPAHFDGERIRLDEPVELERNARLIVTVLPNGDTDRSAWLQFSVRQLDAAYDGADDDYPLESIKEMNPEYEGR
jgi:CelD/BcsL family acetyltransferase involved in cellulose biosynthesis